MAHLDMFDRLRQVVDEYQTLEHQLADPEVLSDQTQLRTLSKRYNDLGPVVEKFRLHQLLSSDRDAAQEMLPDATGDDRELMQAEIDEAEAQLPGLEDELREMMLPKDPFDGKNVVIEIRGAEGGEEANLFARRRFRHLSGTRPRFPPASSRRSPVTRIARPAALIA